MLCPNKNGEQKKQEIAYIFHSKRVPSIDDWAPSGFGGLLFDNVESARRPRVHRNSTHRLIELRKRRTQLIILKCTIMEVNKMAHISKRLAPFRLGDGAPDNAAPPAHMFRGGFDWPRTSNPNKISLP